MLTGVRTQPSGMSCRRSRSQGSYRLAWRKPLFDLGRRPGYALHAFPVNKVRRKYGLAPLPPDFRWAIVDGDVTLYADIPEVVPMRTLPATHRFAGPILGLPR